MAPHVILIGVDRHVVWQCLTCGVIATCPEIVYDQHRAEGGYHYCPNGHQWGWSKENSEREELRRERDRLKQREAMFESHLRAAEARTAKLEKRIKAGVCPCCQRTFVNMGRHMKSKHPGFGSNVVPIAEGKR